MQNTPTNANMAKPETSAKQKSHLTTLLLAFFFSIFGVHRFYTGYIGIGFAQLFTLGGLGLWSVIDVICISFNRYKDKMGNPLKDYNMPAGIVIAVVTLLVAVLQSMVRLGNL